MIALLSILVAAVATAQGFITFRLWRSALYTREQQIAQTGLVWLLPMVGGLIVYAGLRHADDVPRLEPNPEGGEHEALWDNGPVDSRGE